MSHELVPSSSDPAPVDATFDAYVQWAHALLGPSGGSCLLDESLEPLACSRDAPRAPLTAHIRALGWRTRGCTRAPFSAFHDGRCWSVLPVESTEGELLGALALEQTSGTAPELAALAARLQPLLECLRGQLQAHRARQAAMQWCTERGDDLQWLLERAALTRRTPDDESALQALLQAATARMNGAFGVLYVPERHVCLQQCDDAAVAEDCVRLWERSRTQMSAWVRQKRRPMVLNGHSLAAASCGKILLAPVAGDAGSVGGVLAFFRTPQAADYRQRHLLLAGHLGRLASSLVESQIDTLTGLFTREGLEQGYARLVHDTGDECHSVLYLDVDQMHVVNELYGFEIGNELLVRVADLLGPPHLPGNALAARIAADRFAVLLPDIDTANAATVAQRLQHAIAHLAIGPVDNPIDATASCGLSAVLSLPQGLARALAAAELACKTAKKAGRNRIKVDTCDDGTMLRRHVDAVMVGQLRTALKADRLLLYAQPIVSLRNGKRPAGYEILLRVDDPVEGVVLPGSMVAVAERYRLLPSVDRWVVRKTLQMLAAHRGVLEASGVGISINLTGQSMGDEAFTRELIEVLSAAQLPAGLVTFEITEQAAVSSLARAAELIGRLSPLGCRFALDDFGTGANSLTYLNSLPIARVKIDGSFVRDVLTNPRCEATVRGIVELARGFSIDTVAEYVESEALAARVTLMGVDYAQGYAFGKPEPFEGVLEGLQREVSQRLPQSPVHA